MHERTGAHRRRAAERGQLAGHRGRVRGRVRRRVRHTPELDMIGSFVTGQAPVVVAPPIGIAFGWCLERAGLGSARKLMGQFQLTDLAVFKVMFSAIVTAMLGLFWVLWLGAIDVGRIYLPETFLVPQLVGGVIFGAGMALAGL